MIVEHNNFEEFHGRLMGYFRRKNISHWDCEDLAQSVLCKIVAINRNKKDITTPYLYAAARNTFINKLRADECSVISQAVGCGENVLMEEVVAPEDFSPEYGLREYLLIRNISRVINAMSDYQKEAFVLSKVEGFSMASIANRRGVTVSAVEKNLKRASDRVRSGIEGEIFDEAV